MIFRILATVLAVGLFAVAPASVAQTTSGDVTFEMPLNLTDMSSDIIKIQVACSITSDAIPPNQPGPKGASRTVKAQIELPVTGGQLVTTAKVVVPVSGLDNPIGKTANYKCSITGYSASLQRWNWFSEADPTPAFRLMPTPERFTGSFVW